MPGARPPPGQSQYLFAAELDAHPARPSSMPRAAGSPTSPTSTSHIPPAVAAGQGRMQAREATLGPLGEAYSSESSLDPSALRPPPRKRAASTGASTHPGGESSDPGTVPSSMGLPHSRSTPLSRSLAISQGKDERPATTIAAATGGGAARSTTPPIEAFSFGSTPMMGATAAVQAHDTSGQQESDLGGAPFARVTTAPSIAVERKLPPVPVVAPSHLPPLVKGLTGLTAYANWDVSNDVEWSLAKIVGPAALHEVMKDPDAFQSFRDFIASTGDEAAPLLLDLYRDLLAFSHVCTTLRLSSSCISSTYLLKTSPSRLSLPISLRGPLLECLCDAASTGHPLLEPLQALHADVYSKFFQPFVQQKLVEQVVARLASWKAGLGWTGKGGPIGGGGGGAGLSMAATDGLAECYCLTDPTLHDNPITLASEGFAELTGYPLKLVIGRNCRFLQGPGTSPESVKRLHDALAEGKNVTSLIFNYRADGSAFANLLCMAPLKDEKGLVRHFIGGQIDVTGALNALVQSPALAAHPSLWLHAAAPPSPSSAPSSVSSAPSFTPLVQAQINRLTIVSRQTGVSSGDALRELGAATALGAASSGEGVDPSQPLPGGPAASSGHEDEKKRKGPLGFLSKAAKRSTSTLSIRDRSSFESTPAGGDEAPLESGKEGLQGQAGERGEAGTKKEERGSGKGDSGSRAKEQGETDSLAESLMHTGLRAFEQTYSRLALVDRSSGNILYTTPELVEHCGLPASSHHELHSTPFTKILVAPSSQRAFTLHSGESSSQSAAMAEEEKDQTRRLRRNVRLAVDNGHGWKGLVGLQPVAKKLFGRHKHGEQTAREAVLHLTPLCNKEGKVEALVAVFG